MPEGKQAPPAVCLVGGPRAGQQEAVRQQEGGAGLVSGRRGSSWQEDTHVPKRECAEAPDCGILEKAELRGWERSGVWREHAQGMLRAAARGDMRLE